MQVPQMGFGQGGEKTKQVYQTGNWWGHHKCPTCYHEVKNKGHTTHKVFVKASKISVVGMVSKPTSKVAEPLEPPGLPQGQKP